MGVQESRAEACLSNVVRKALLELPGQNPALMCAQLLLSSVHLTLPASIIGALAGGDRVPVLLALFPLPGLLLIQHLCMRATALSKRLCHHSARPLSSSKGVSGLWLSAAVIQKASLPPLLCIAAEEAVHAFQGALANNDSE